jgi:hypothetical protein
MPWGFFTDIRKDNRVTKAALLLCITALFGYECPETNRHYIFSDLEKVSYDNGTSATEAKIIGDAYLYLYAREGSKVLHVRKRSGKDDKKHNGWVTYTPVLPSAPRPLRWSLWKLIN